VKSDIGPNKRSPAIICFQAFKLTCSNSNKDHPSKRRERGHRKDYLLKGGWRKGKRSKR
jgi:hypothetical protein